MAAALSSTALPSIPASFSEKYDIIGRNNLAVIWSNRLSHTTDMPRLPEPKTVIIQDAIRMSNLVPQDSANPLYAEEYGDLSDSFILDNLVAEKVDFKDPKLDNAEKVMYKTLSNKDLIVSKNPDTDKFALNGISVKKIETLEDGTDVITTSNFLFDHRQKVQDAFKKFSKAKSGYQVA